MADKQTIERLKDQALEMRELVLKLSAKTVIHLGGDLSMADMMTALYMYKMKKNLDYDGKWPERDRFVMSKGQSPTLRVNYVTTYALTANVVDDLGLPISGATVTFTPNDAESGTVRVGGVDVRDYNLDVLRREVSMVLQKNVLFSGTILDNLRWGDANATEEECIRMAKLACADEFIERFPDKYNTWIEQGGSNVSGGQKQRLTIARALLRKPKVLILDDSTSAVDTATDAKIRKAFREEIPGTTKIIIAQRISSVQDADRILVLDNGQINGLGTHEELLRTNAIYQDVFNSQTGGAGDFDEGGDPA